ncbi:hypothetical protein [Nostoc sp.]|uniref:hypothetical protein n=1 Tax=Nostoc sp. TaxID=1180 RepID=UPI002FF7AC4B
MSDLENFTPKLTADHSFRFVSQEFGESFFYAAVRTALLSAGLVIYSTPPVVRRSPGTVTAHSESAKLKTTQHGLNALYR